MCTYDKRPGVGFDFESQKLKESTDVVKSRCVRKKFGDLKIHICDLIAWPQVLIWDVSYERQMMPADPSRVVLGTLQVKNGSLG